MTSRKIYQFDGITVDVAAMRICRGTADLVLEAKTFRLLQFLIEAMHNIEQYRLAMQVDSDLTVAVDQAIASKYF